MLSGPLLFSPLLSGLLLSGPLLYIGRPWSAVAIQDGCVLLCSINGFSYLYSICLFVNHCVKGTMSEPLEKRLDSFEASLRFMSDKSEES